MYGLLQHIAQEKAAQLQRIHPENKYEVAPHSTTVTGAPLTWGVKRYVPYCEAMPFRLDGFVWFPRDFSILAPR